jgi:hypothetical protein
MNGIVQFLKAVRNADDLLAGSAALAFSCGRTGAITYIGFLCENFLGADVYFFQNHLNARVWNTKLSVETK